MPVIIQYLLKLSISLGLVYSFYILFLRRLTFYNWNRWYLLGYSLLCFIISFTDIASLLHDWKDEKMIRIIPAIGSYIAEDDGQRWLSWDLLQLAMLAGAALMGLRLAIQFLSYRRLRRSASLLVYDSLKIYQVEDRILPFSFGNSIFISRHCHGEEELKEIIRHEFVHVKQRHTVDILFAEFLCMFNWYNPFAWLIRRSIRQNLEFIADNQVLANGVDRKQYQYLLLKVTGMSQFSIGSSFNFSSIKKRIAMMNKIKSARVQMIRFLFLLPLGAAMLLSFRSNRHSLSGLRSMHDLTHNDTIPLSDIKGVEINGKKIKITLKNGTEKQYNLEDSTDRIRFQKEIPPPPPPANPLPPPPPPKEPLTSSAAPVPPPPPPPVPSNEFVSVRAAAPVAEATATAPSVKTTTRLMLSVKPVTEAATAPSVKGTTQVRLSAKPASAGQHALKEAQSDPLVIIDDREGSLKEVSPDMIKSMNVYKDSLAISKYGQRGSHGVIVIDTKPRSSSAGAGERPVKTKD